MAYGRRNFKKRGRGRGRGQRLRTYRMSRGGIRL